MAAPKKRVLVVEDDGHHRQMMAESLTKTVDVVPVGTMAEAISQINAAIAAQDEFAAVVLDMFLDDDSANLASAVLGSRRVPNDGIVLAKWIRTKSAAPILGVSNFAARKIDDDVNKWFRDEGDKHHSLGVVDKRLKWTPLSRPKSTLPSERLLPPACCPPPPAPFPCG